MNSRLHFSLIMMFFASLAAPPAGAQQVVYLTYETNPNFPYIATDHSESSSDSPPGITVELLNIVADELEIKFEFERLPWARGVNWVKSNKLDGIFHTSFVAERAEYFVYPMVGDKLDVEKRIMNQSYKLLTRADSAVTWDGKMMHNVDLAVGTIIEYSVNDQLIKMGIPIATNKSLRSNIVMLNKHRLSGIADLKNRIATLRLKEPELFLSIVEHPLPIISKPYFLVFSKRFYQQNPLLANEIWAKIEQIRKSPRHQALKDKYMALGASMR